MERELLRMENIRKVFHGNTVLNRVNLNVFKGETLALIGENGAGKSTLIEILCGFLHKDGGELYFEEEEFMASSPTDAQRQGIHYILQEPAVMPNLTVAQNIYLYYGNHNKNLKFSNSSIRKSAKDLLERLQIDLDPDCYAGKLTLSQQYLLEVAMAICTKSKLLVLDETTASMNSADSALVARIIGEYKKEGNSVLFISHDLEEVIKIADRITILRDGINAGTLRKKDFSREKIIKLLLGKEMSSIYHRTFIEAHTELLRMENAGTGGSIKNISFSVRSGEIVGLTGLIGSGKSEVAKAAFGIRKLTEGDVFLNGERQKKFSPGKAMKQKVAYIPEGRVAMNIFPNMSAEENISAALTKKISRMGFLVERMGKYIARSYIGKLKIGLRTQKQDIRTLSGGNQQKTILARWLATQPKLLILDEPTDGLDMASKKEVYRILNQMALDGVGILLVSSNVQEIVQMCDRVLIISKGKIVNEMDRDDITGEKILQRLN